MSTRPASQIFPPIPTWPGDSATRRCRWREGTKTPRQEWMPRAAEDEEVQVVEVEEEMEEEEEEEEEMWMGRE